MNERFTKVYVEGQPEAIREVIEFIRPRIGKGKIEIVKINEGTEEDE